MQVIKHIECVSRDDILVELFVRAKSNYQSLVMLAHTHSGVGDEKIAV